jgi:hypothetical protein
MANSVRRLDEEFVDGDVAAVLLAQLQAMQPWRREKYGQWGTDYGKTSLGKSMISTGMTGTRATTAPRQLPARA